MDLRAYYQKIREIETRIEEAFAIVVSLETGDGGKAGIATEVSRGIAAKMVVEGIVRMAAPEEVAEFLTQKAEAVRVAVQEAAAGQVQLSVVSTSELNQLKAAVRSLQE
jgi:hypothetical protein